MLKRGQSREINKVLDLSEEEESEYSDIGYFHGEKEKEEFEAATETKKEKWYMVPFYNKQMRIGYVLTLCVGLVVCVPLVLDTRGFFPREDPIESKASCGVRDDFRLDCLPDRSFPLVDECDSRRCCWDSGFSNTTYCYHRLPSTIGMRYESRSVDGSSGSVYGEGYDNVQMHAKFLVSSDRNGHVMFEMGKTLSDPLPINPDGEDSLEAVVSCLEGGSCTGEMLTLDVRLKNWADQTSIARTHYGPVVYSQHLSEISFYLPTNWVYGTDLDNFMFTGKEETSYFNLGSRTQAHLPVVFGMHTVQDWFLLYLETDQPGSQTFIKGSGSQPILTWRFMGGNIKVHFFVAPTQPELLRKFRSYVMSGWSSVIPSYSLTSWKYGFHMCRRTGNPDLFNSDVEMMRETGIPFESDCIDERIMPTSFTVNETGFNLTVLEDARVVLPFPVQRLVVGEPDKPCLETNGGSAACLVGSFNNVNVSFPDVFDPEYKQWLSGQYNDFTALPKSAVYLHDIVPKDESDQSCGELHYVPKGMDLSHVVCLRSWIPSMKTELVDKFAGYSKQLVRLVMEVFSDAIDVRSDVTSIGMPETVTFTGSKVAASWEGMQRALKEVLMLSSVGLPFVSMPACGSHSVSNVTNRDLMCLRWYQLASFMPGIHSWYSEDDRDRTPFMLPKSYQRYIRWSLEQRYKLQPYMKTLDRQWFTSSLPMVRPMFMENRDLDFHGVWTQFMLGRDILVAPVISGDSEFVDIRFPEGTWYTLGSNTPVSLPAHGANISYHSKVYEIPAFQRGGSAIVVYESPGFTIQETERSQFLMMIGLECAPDPRLRLGLCYANGISYLNAESNQLNITVTSFQERGTISLQMMNPPEVTLNSINSIIVSGMKKYGEVLTIDLPGLSLTAADSIDNSQGTAPVAVYNADKQNLMIRNLNMTFLDYSNTDILWTFSDV